VQHDSFRNCSIRSESRLAYPTSIRHPRRGFPSEYCHDIWCGKTRMVWLLDGEKKLKICLFVLTECTTYTQTDRQTDGQTDTAWRLRPRFHSVARQKGCAGGSLLHCWSWIQIDTVARHLCDISASGSYTLVNHCSSSCSASSSWLYRIKSYEASRAGQYDLDLADNGWLRNASTQSTELRAPCYTAHATQDSWWLQMTHYGRDVRKTEKQFGFVF